MLDPKTAQSKLAAQRLQASLEQREIESGLDPFIGFKKHLINEKRIDSDYQDNMRFTMNQTSIHSSKTSKILYDEPIENNRFSTLHANSVQVDRKVSTSMDTRTLKFDRI